VLEVQIGTIEATSVITQAAQADYHSILSSNILGVFTADGVNGVELWGTDGTSAGTGLVKDNLGWRISNLTSLVNGKALFIVSSGAYDQLWVTDGTAAGTVLITPNGSYPQFITSLGNGKAVFSAYDFLSGQEMWITDGTVSGTNLVKDINTFGSSTPGGFNSSITSLGNGKVLFNANDGSGPELWTTDGTAAGTSLVAGSPLSYPQYITSLGNGKVLFNATDASNGQELWVSDGTAAGTNLVKDIYAGIDTFSHGLGNSNPRGFSLLGNGRALFSATNAANGEELWVTDGTTAGTSLVKDIHIGIASSNPYGITSLGNGTALFGAYSAGYKLWITDGTEVGTNLVKEIFVGGDASPSSITSLGNGKAVFSVDNGINGTELWITDGTAAGTSLVKDIYAGAGSSAPKGFTLIGDGKAMFSADNGINGIELWITDGTAAGTNLFKDINLGINSSNPSAITRLNFAPVLTIPATVSFTDTAFVDDFNNAIGTQASGTLVGTDVNMGATLTYGIAGGINNGATVSKSNAYGTLTVTKATGAYNFVANSAAIEPLAANVIDSAITVTVSDGALSDSKVFSVAITQNGVTESIGNDSLTGTIDNDIFNALAGNDTINGLEGIDTMIGGLGNDVYYVDNVGDVVIENVGGGDDMVNSTVLSYTLSANF
jgi:ELWxxDGT repeat protein